MGSIFDRLSSGNDEPKIFKLPIKDSSKLYQSTAAQPDVVFSGSYVLQPPPFTANYQHYSTSFYSSTTSLSSLPQPGDMPLHLMAAKDVDLESVLEEQNFLATFQHQQLGESSSFSENTCTSQNVASSQRVIQEPQHISFMESKENKDTNSDDLQVEDNRISFQQRGYIQEPQSDVKIAFAKYRDGTLEGDCKVRGEETSARDLFDEYSLGEDSSNDDSVVDKDATDLGVAQDNPIILTFSSLSNCNSYNDVIHFGSTISDSGCHHDTPVNTHTAEESLTSLNLTINPHHFDPLEHITWRQ